MLAECLFHLPVFFLQDLPQHMGVYMVRQTTTRQAGLITGKAKVKQLTPFHFSPRYQDQGYMLEKEAMDAYHYALKQ